jgi:hypothetical protein
MFYLKSIVFISVFFVLLIFGFNSFVKYRYSSNFFKKNPEYKLIVNFSKKYKALTGLELYSYGVNQSLPKGYKFKNEVADFKASYYLHKKRTDCVGVNEARAILVSVTEAFICEVNSDPEVTPRLEQYPITNKQISISIYFVDENNVGLGSGVSDVYFKNGEVTYEKYDISDYGGRSNTMGKHSIICTETYEEALDIATKDGSLAFQTNLLKTRM